MITKVTKLYDVYTNTFSAYKMVKDGITSSVPLDEANKDYQAIQQWKQIVTGKHHIIL